MAPLAMSARIDWAGRMPLLRSSSESESRFCTGVLMWSFRPVCWLKFDSSAHAEQRMLMMRGFLLSRLPARTERGQ